MALETASRRRRSKGDKRIRTRAKLLEAARELIREKAYERTTNGGCRSPRRSAEEDDDVGTLYEELLTADPSGMEGRPGSADAARH
jgi:hypothetical protein